MSGNGFDFDLDEELEGKSPIEDAEVVQDESKVEEPKHAVNDKNAVANTQKGAVSTDVAQFTLEGIEGIEQAVVGETGITASIFPIERVMFTKERKQMVSLLTSQVMAIKQHYHDDVGRVLCNQKDCCDLLGLPSIRYVYPVVVYDCDKTGKPVTMDLELKLLILGKDAYETIKTIHDMNGDIGKLDIVVTCTDEKYQKCSYTPAGDARWRKSDKLVAMILEKWNTNKKHVLLPVGRVMDKEEIMRRIASKNEEGTSHEKRDSSPATGKGSFDDVNWDK